MGGTGGVPGEEREAKAGRGVGGAGTSAGRELERGSMGEYAAGTGRWWEAEAGGKVHPAARAVLELSEELEPSGIEPPMCNSLLLGLLTDRFGGGSETPVLDYVQLIEDEVLGDALIGQVLLHGKVSPGRHCHWAGAAAWRLTLCPHCCKAGRLALAPLQNRAERIPEELYDARLSTGRFGGRGRGRE